jgi:hypothetical protein
LLLSVLLPLSTLWVAFFLGSGQGVTRLRDWSELDGSIIGFAAFLRIGRATCTTLLQFSAMEPTGLESCHVLQRSRRLTWTQLWFGYAVFECSGVSISYFSFVISFLRAPKGWRVHPSLFLRSRGLGSGLVRKNHWDRLGKLIAFRRWDCI